MAAYVDIVTTPTADTPGACLYLHFDNRRYMFGRIAEGTQRAFNKRKLSAGLLEHLFITGETSWDTVGGLMGMLLTVADIMRSAKTSIAEVNAQKLAKGQLTKERPGIDRLDIHGAENLTYMMATARHFVFRTGMPFKTVELFEDRRMADPQNLEPDFQDERISVWKVPLSKTSRKRKLEDESTQDTEMDNNGSGDKTPRKQLNAKERETLTRLVENMFNSSWSMDTLIPTKLRDVAPGAQIFVREAGGLCAYDGPQPGEVEAAQLPDIDVLVREAWPAAKVNSLPETSHSSQSLCYIVKNAPRRGKFDAARANELGVCKADNKLLTAGQSVVGKDGIMVTPDMVIGPPIQGTAFVIIDIPDPSYLESFFSRPEWTNDQLMGQVHAMYWILGKGIVANPDIQKFMRARPSVEHISLSPDTSPNVISHPTTSTLLSHLHQIDPARFPLPSSSTTMPDLGIPDPLPCKTGCVGRRIKTLPAIKPDNRFEEPLFVPAKPISDEHATVAELAKHAADKASDPEFLAEIEEEEKDIPNRDAEIIALGTGSTLPSAYRNVSATLIRVPGVGNYLLDCGENTLGQIRRLFGYEEAVRILKDLRGIVISHMHADHHLGTVAVLKAWQSEVDSTATLAMSCPSFMQRFLQEYSRVEHLEMGRLRWFCESEVQLAVSDASGLAEIKRVPVDHCKGAAAAVLTWPSGLRIAYSGDCRPSSLFAREAEGAHLLIHEATFEDDKGADALAKKHSTVGEALEVARMMRARRVLLTHFSQRYHTMMSEAEDAAREGNRQVVLKAFDLMRVKLGDFRVAELFVPAIGKLVEEAY